MLRSHQSIRLAGICLFSEFGGEGMSIEGQMDLEEYLQLLEDTKQRCAVLQHNLQEYTDAVVHRCSITVFVFLTTLHKHNMPMSVPDPEALHATHQLVI